MKVAIVDLEHITDEQKNKLEEFSRELDKSQAEIDFITKLQLKQYNPTIDQQINDYKKDGSKVFFLYDDHKIIGYGVAEPVKIVSGFYNITQLYIEPQYRHRHLGKFLVNEMIKILKINGINLVGIEAITKNTIATKLYKSLGFKPVTTYYRKQI